MSCSGITFEESDTICFVVTCLFASAIDRSELRRWCTDVVIKNCTVDEIPGYIFELMSFEKNLGHVFEVIGFVPSWEPSEDEGRAIYGIAALRGRLAEDAPITADEAKKC
ncbi:hypothetical protein [Pantoea sp. 18069]|uniref:hypothetical protein n=1 Tax=Pantoea sp. 18069 TaxID=2681415 RepID=UPI001359C9F2|nr:hypothetical protein [Pantoea sp. 18069]